MVINQIASAAIATILDPPTNSPLSQYPIVTRFMKAVFLARPPSRKVKPIWSHGPGDTEIFGSVTGVGTATVKAA